MICTLLIRQAPKKKTVTKAKKSEKKPNPLFAAEPRSYRVGGAIRVRRAIRSRAPPEL
jgi:hypothetical protein